ncbi:flagellar hook protein FlgE [Methylobacterium sp. JK268]
MSLFGALRTGASGMNAQSNRISTVADNVQNAGTTGYKKADTEFSSLLIARTSGGDYNSGSVDTVVRHEISGTSSIVNTTSDSDLAIQGNGFFVVQDAGSKVNYLTRAGNFVLDQQSNTYKNAGGFTLMGYPANAANPTLNSYDGLVPVDLSPFGMKPSQSTKGTITGNLPSTAATGTTKNSSLVVYDTQGKPVKLDMSFTYSAAPTSGNGGSWSVAFTSNDATISGGPANLTFGTNGAVTAGSPAAITLPNGQSVSVDLSKVTNLAGDYSLTGSSDGNKPSAVTGTQFAADGTIYAVYDDNSKIAAFKVPVATVGSPDSLDPRSGNVFQITNESGPVQVGFAGSGGRGSILSKSLEQSNVDVATELTSMISSQTVYTANSKVFMTSNEMLDTLMQLKR